MGKLISVPATIIADLNITLGTPTVRDVINFLNTGHYTLEIYEPIVGGAMSIIVKQTDQPTTKDKGVDNDY